MPNIYLSLFLGFGTSVLLWFMGLLLISILTVGPGLLIFFIPLLLNLAAGIVLESLRFKTIARTVLIAGVSISIALPFILL